jgi:hypothetical protein
MGNRGREGEGVAAKQKKEAESVANERNMGGVACGWKVVGGDSAHRWKWWCAPEVLSGAGGEKEGNKSTWFFL